MGADHSEHPRARDPAQSAYVYQTRNAFERARIPEFEGIPFEFVTPTQDSDTDARFWRNRPRIHVYQS